MKSLAKPVITWLLPVRFLQMFRRDSRLVHLDALGGFVYFRLDKWDFLDPGACETILDGFYIPSQGNVKKCPWLATAGVSPCVIPAYFPAGSSGSLMFPEVALPPGLNPPHGISPRPAIRKYSNIVEALQIRYWRTADVFPHLPSISHELAKREALESATKHLRDQCPHQFPTGWPNCSADYVASVIEWNRKKENSLLTALELLKKLGIDKPDGDPSLLMDFTTVHDHPEGVLFEPVTLAEILEQGRLGEFIEKLLPSSHRLLLECLLLPGAPAAALAHLIEGKPTK